MNFDDTADEADFRLKAREWIRINGPHELDAQLSILLSRSTSVVELPMLEGVDRIAECKKWQRRKFDAGWACLRWPKDFGGQAASAMRQVIWHQEEGFYSLLSDLFAVGHGMAGPTIMEHGTHEQKIRYLRPIASGEDLWCQLFSEPSGGSDLAGLRSRATKTQNGWLLNGQKIWTTHAQVSDFGLLIARTDPSVPKHRGLTMFILDMKSPGIEIRPIKQTTGDSTFNEVFFTDVEIPDENVIGNVGDGWRVSLTTLMNERLRLANAPTAVPELIDFLNAIALNGHPAIDDPGVRARIAGWVAQSAGLRYTTMRMISAVSQGRTPGPESSIIKIVLGSLVQDIAAFALDLQGPQGAVIEEDDYASRFQKLLISSVKNGVGGGTTEIQRNIVGERVLGLPPEPRVDKGVSYSELMASGI